VQLLRPPGEANTSSGFDGRFSISAAAAPATAQPNEFISIFFQEFAPVLERKPPISLRKQRKKNPERSRRLFSAPESKAVYILLRCSEASTSRQSSSSRAR